MNYEFLSAPSGYFIYLKLPEKITGTEFENIIRKEGISLFSSDRFSIESRKHSHGVRISLTGTENIKEMEKGLLLIKKRLSEI